MERSAGFSAIGLFVSFILAASVGMDLSGCSSSAKKPDSVELKELEGKKVALVELSGEATSRRVIESALVNQLTQNGSFILLSREEIEKARSQPGQSPTDWRGVARAAGADYALRVEVIEFSATEHNGYDKEKVYDSQMAAERGEDDDHTERVYKVRALEGKVKFRIEFTRLADSTTKAATAEKSETLTSEAKSEAAHLPPRLRFLERLSNDAFKTFFDNAS